MVNVNFGAYISFLFITVYVFFAKQKRRALVGWGKDSTVRKMKAKRECVGFEPTTSQFYELSALTN